MKLRRVVRVTCTVLWGLISGAWLVTLPANPLIEPFGRVSQTADQATMMYLATRPTWQDTLIAQITISNIGVQRFPIAVVWSQYQAAGFSINYQYPLTIVSDGAPHQYVIPIGLHPAWIGDIRNIHIVAEQKLDRNLLVAQMKILKRPCWSLDLLLGIFLHTFIRMSYPWSNLVIITAALAMTILVLLYPKGHWRKRLRIATIPVGGAISIITLLTIISITRSIYQFYFPLDETIAKAYVTPLTESSDFDAKLISSAQQLPNGPILIDGFFQDSYISTRARYLLYPRRVDTRPLSESEIAQKIYDQGYVGIIRAHAGDRAPGPGWQQIGDRSVAPFIWSKTQALPPVRHTVPGADAIFKLFLGMMLILILGWMIAANLGWNSLERLCCAWPFGAAALAWWMFILATAGFTWSWPNIGLPLLFAALCLGLRTRSALSTAFQYRVTALQPGILVWIGIVILAIFIGCILIDATLVPFSDVDTWRVWSLKGQAFYIDGGMDRVLRLYRALELYHSSYPPSQPLIQTWGYITLGGISERLIKIVFPIWYISCISMTWAMCRQWCSDSRAMLWTVMLAATPIMLDHATLGNADLPIATVLMIGISALVRWIERGTSLWLVSGVIAMGSAAWIKIDGIYLGGLYIGLAVFIRIFCHTRGRSALLQTICVSILSFLLFLGIIIPWRSYTLALGLNSDIPGLDVLKTQRVQIIYESFVNTIEEVLLSHSNSPFGLLGGGYGLLWLICGGALLSSRSTRDDSIFWFLWLAIAGSFLFYVGIYTLHPYYSIERYLLHIAPIAVLAAARGTRRAQRLAPTQSSKIEPVRWRIPAHRPRARR